MGVKGGYLRVLRTPPALGRSTCVERELLGCEINKLRLWRDI